MAHYKTNNYLNPTYPETSFSFTVGLYQSIVPSGQGHFSEQPPPTGNKTESDATLYSKDPYNVGSGNAVGLISATDNENDYTFKAFTDNVNQYNDSGILTGSGSYYISFLRPAYSSTLKTSRFPITRTSGIVNTQAHKLATDAATSGGGFNYLSNAYYYVTTKSTVNFSQYQILNSGSISKTYTLNQETLSNNILSISQASGTLSKTLDY